MVFDTSVLADALVGDAAARTEALRALLAARAVIVPDSARAELVNVLWKLTAAGRLSLEAGLDALDIADRWLSSVLPATELWTDALHLAVERAHPAYDTLFVAAAMLTGTQVITRDRALRRRFPEHVVTVREFLARA